MINNLGDDLYNTWLYVMAVESSQMYQEVEKVVSISFCFNIPYSGEIPTHFISFSI